MDAPTTNPLLAQARAAYAQALQDPAMAARFAGMVHAEVGGQGPQAQQAFAESVLNRAAARGQTLDQVLSGSYFPQLTYDRAARFAADPKVAGQYGGMLGDVLGGSNVANFATGNASGTVGFAGGPQVAAYGGERFGVEGPDQAWAKRLMGGALPQQAPMSMAPQVAQAAPTAVPQPTPQVPAPAQSAAAVNPMQAAMGNPLGAIQALGNLFGSMAPKQQAPQQQAAQPVRRQVNPQSIALAIQAAMQPMNTL
ncbi:hypothetical protein [Xanthobacter versatilis]|uniref:hypothetical protein n=1 Tax=Xanthobacter autotrophicus (strain ATCC BAA-1158 / Py2) TaxID=78245 RepID=UPI00372C0AF1